jgi:putative glutamine amidotransferase
VSSARKPVPGCTVAVTASIRPDGDTNRVRLTAAYVTALENAGLIPLIVPPLSRGDAAAAILQSVSGLVLTGGEDVDPARYGEKRHEKVRSVNAARDATEASLIEQAKARGKPVLAICRGIQILNVALGGTLVQDIPSEWTNPIVHDGEWARTARVHEVDVTAGSRLARALGTDRPVVNSMHHQAVGAVAAPLATVARAPDGMVEGVEWPDDDWWMVGVQWHPEELTASPEPWDRSLFATFADVVARTGRLS